MPTNFIQLNNKEDRSCFFERACIMAVKRMDLAWVSVRNIKKSTKFFTQALGLEVASGGEEFGWIELVGKDGGLVLGLGEEKDKESPVQPGNNAVITMTVDNIKRSKTAFEKKGATFIGDIFEVPGKLKIAMFQDPDGNYFHLVQELDK